MSLTKILTVIGYCSFVSSFSGLQKKRFELPQESEEMEEYYCNESTYANLNILFVAGVMQLDPSVTTAASTSVAFSKQKFDAWPTKEQKDEAIRKRNKRWSHLGIRIPSDY